jgi:hypothetical protein
MRQGCYDAIETLEQAWLKLARFYPSDHFDQKTPDHFFSEFIARRFAWHRQVYEPRGPGSSGTIVHEIVGGAVLDDVATAVAETVEGLWLGFSLLDFDIEKWRRDWATANRNGE